MSELFIHQFRCPECEAVARADRSVGCWNCGTTMEQEKQIATIQIDR